jgi:hypothetical protein
MADWKKVIVSGSDISQLNNDANYLLTGDTATLSGSFSGSFVGNGSGLTNVPASGIDLADLTDGNGIADFTYDGGTAASIAVEADGSTLSVGASGVKVSDLGVDTAQLAAGAVTSAKLADDAVTSGKIADGAFTVAISGDAVGSATSIASDAVSVAVSLAAGVVDTAELADDAVTNAKIGVGAVGTTEIGDEQVTNDKLADDAVGTAEIAANAVTSAKIAADSITVAQLSGSAVVTAAEGIGSNNVDTAVPTAAAVKAYADSVVGASDLDISTDAGSIDIDLDSETLGINGKAAGGIVVSGSGTDVTIEVAAGGVTNAMLAGSIANAKLANSSMTIAGASVALGGSVSGDDIISDVSAAQITNAQLANDSVTIGTTEVDLGASATTVAGLTLTGAVGSGSFSGSFVGDGSALTGVQASDLANSLTDGNGIADFTFNGSAAASIALDLDGATLAVSATGVKVADGGVDTSQLAADAVDGTKIADLAVDTEHLAASAVETAKINDLAVTTGKLAANAVTTAKITDGNVTNAKLENSSLTIAADSGTSETANLGDTVTFAGGTNISTAVAGTDTVTVSLDASPSVTNLTVSNDVTIAGDLTVSGTASFQETVNLAIADRFILLASGSNAAGDGGIVVQQATQDVGDAFAFEGTSQRWGVADAFDAKTSAITFDAFMASVSTGNFSTDAAIQAGIDSRYSAKGNIFVGDDQGIWIYS